MKLTLVMLMRCGAHETATSHQKDCLSLQHAGVAHHIAVMTHSAASVGQKAPAQSSDTSQLTFNHLIMLQTLAQRLLDPRCANILPFLDWNQLSGRFAGEWLLPVFSELPALVDWAEICRCYRPWMRELVAKNAGRINWMLLSMDPDKASCRFLRDHPEHLHWDELCVHAEYAYMQPLFEENIDKVDLMVLAKRVETSWSGRVNWIGSFIVAHADRGDRFDWNLLSSNAAAWMAKLFRTHPDRVDWNAVCRRPRIELFDLLCEFGAHLNWPMLTKKMRKWMEPLFVASQEFVDWKNLSKEPKNWMLPVMFASPERFDWDLLSANPQEWMLNVFLSHPNYLVWSSIMEKRSKWMEMLFRSFPDRVDWHQLCEAPEPWMLLLFLKFPDRLNWSTLKLTVDGNADHWLEGLMCLEVPRAGIRRPRVDESTASGCGKRRKRTKC
jgi:hypothetical protein